MNKIPQPDIILINKDRQNKNKTSILKERCGVYVLYVDTICVYTGMSKNLFERTSRIRYKGQASKIPKVLKTLLENSQDIQIHIYFTNNVEDGLLLEQAIIHYLYPALILQSVY